MEPSAITRKYLDGEFIWNLYISRGVLDAASRGRARLHERTPSSSSRHVRLSGALLSMQASSRSSSMERTSQWVSSQDVPTDLIVRVAGAAFPLHKATAGDLLALALDGAGERVINTESLRRVVAAFVERESGAGRNRRASLSGAAALGAGALQKVAKMVDEVAAEIATDESLPISKFVGVAGAVPKDARATHDCLYRAVDIYLKAHPKLDEIEREKVCSVMDTLKLSYTARIHASQNKRLPLQAVLSALYYDQLKLRSAGVGHDDEDSDARSEAGSARMQAKADAALARENEALRSELARMRAHMSSGVQQSKGSGSRTAATATVPGKKASFFGSMSRTLSRLNPFRAGGGWSKDTSSIRDSRGGAMNVVKPKRRRSSIS
ncbi:unnamed protein product [Triticum turgidum subsp. durum]|uniref:NPH3 domain-containing protein n=1 Tax=Triticum turgidum subsp. durum TaxID=4567 RepID=A0A9R0W0T9_TRITD|nr:unnamed protein product [Triticum turgidum subsp. durum]